MKAPFSPYLKGITERMRRLVAELSESYEYVSLHSADSVGFRVTISQRARKVSNTNMTTERGNVVRVCRKGQIGRAHV